MAAGSVSRIARKIASDCVCTSTRKAARILTRLYDEALRPSGLQGSQLGVLVAVAMFGPDGATVGRLAKPLAMDRTTMTRNLRPLEKAGLVRSGPSKADGRARVIVLTDSGAAALEVAGPLWEQAQRRVKALLGAPFLAGLQKDLGVVEAMARD